jgi:CheY-like chemotaxis protein
MRILLVEDNPLDVELVSRMLHRRLRADVEGVHTAEDGLRRLLSEAYDVILLDYSLPGQNGIEFLQELKKRGDPTPVLLVTARGDTHLQDAAREAGAVDFISKDESLTPALSRAVEAAVERGRSARSQLARQQAEALRQSAEQRVVELERHLRALQLAIGFGPLNGQTAPTYPSSAVSGSQHRDLLERYARQLSSWCQGEAGDKSAGDGLVPFASQLFELGAGSEQLWSLHTDAIVQLKAEAWEPPTHVSGRSPQLFILTLGFSLLELYRRAFLSDHRSS